MTARHVVHFVSAMVSWLALGVACISAPRESFQVEQEAGAGGFSLDAEAAAPSPCEQAAQQKAYVGCDYWPTVTSNLVDSIFDFAVAVANVGEEPANVTITGPNEVNKTFAVKGGSLEKVFLPWVSSLKGPEGTGIQRSVVAKGGAYHLVSDRPVVVYQFNPLEYRAVGGDKGKDWSACVPKGSSGECYSYSNDASLLLPSSAMTSTYRIMGSTGWSRHIDPATGQLDLAKPLAHLLPPYFVVTATQDGTKVDVKLGPKANVVGGFDEIASEPANGHLTLSLNAGDVAEVVGGAGQPFDFSGSLLTSNKPVQVITGVACADFPLDVAACDHVEETVFPAETLGKHYVVMPPIGPQRNRVGHIVRIYGNVDGTKLTYKPSKPGVCPDTIDAGEVVDCGEVKIDFEVIGDKEIGIASFMLGGGRADSLHSPTSGTQPQGDPSQSFGVGVEQFRSRYVFLAPTDYKTSFVDVVAEADTRLTLDGSDRSLELHPIDGTDYFGAHLALSSGKDGVHVLEGSKPIGIQVFGYGDNTSYMYPGGLNLALIAPLPPK